MRLHTFGVNIRLQRVTKASLHFAPFPPSSFFSVLGTHTVSVFPPFMLYIFQPVQPYAITVPWKIFSSVLLYRPVGLCISYMVNEFITRYTQHRGNGRLTFAPATLGVVKRFCRFTLFFYSTLTPFAPVNYYISLFILSSTTWRSLIQMNVNF